MDERDGMLRRHIPAQGAGMTAEPPPAQEGLWQELSCDRRWELACEHRQALLAVARRRVPQHAHDVVHEALARAVQAGGLDPQRLGAWLTQVTLRLCVDVGRSDDRHVRCQQRLTGHHQPAPAPESDVCDRAEAAWIAEVARRQLPQRQLDALLLKADGMSLAEVAGELGVSYKTAESLLSRARAAMRLALGSATSVLLALLGWLLGAARRRPGVRTMAAPLVPAAFVLAVIALPQPHPGTPPVPSSLAHGGAAAPAHASPTTTWTPTPTPAAPGRSVPRPVSKPAPTSPAGWDTGDEPTVPVLAPRRLAAPGVEVVTPGVTRQPRDGDLPAAVVDCVTHPQIGLQRLGCPDQPASSPAAAPR